MNSQVKRILIRTAVITAVVYSLVMVGLKFLVGGWIGKDSLGHLLLYSAMYIFLASIVCGLGIPLLSRLLDQPPPSDAE
jgi:hypothetical protein